MGIASASGKLALSKVFSSLIEFFAIAYFAKILSPDSLGLFFLFQSITFLLSMIVDGGLRKSMEKRMSGGKSSNETVSTAIFLKFLSIAVFSLLIVLGRGRLNDFIGGDVSFLLILAFVLHDTTLTSKHVLYGEFRVGETAVIEIIWRAVWFLGGVSLYNMGFGPFSIIYSLIAGFGISTLVGLFKMTPVREGPSIHEFRKLYGFASFDFFSSVGMFAYSWVDVIILGFFVTHSNISDYEIAWKFSLFFVILSRSIAVSIFPQISNLKSKNDFHEISMIITSSLIPVSLMILPAIFGAVLYGGQILELFFGAEYRDAKFVLVILLGEKFFFSIFLILQHSLRALGYPKTSAKATISSMVINIVLNVALIAEFGIFGAALATTLSVVINTVFHGIFMSSIVRFQFPHDSIAWAFLSSMVMVGVLSLIHTFVNQQEPIMVLILIGLGGVVYIITLLSRGKIRESLLDSITTLR